MPPQRRKFNFNTEEDNKPSKRVKSKRPSKPNEATDYGSFSQKKCLALFNEFSCLDEIGPDVIGPEGIVKFCEELGQAPEDIVMLVLAWKMDCKQAGYFTLKEWLKGLSELHCDSIPKLRNKLDYLRSLLNDPQTFKNIYRYAFEFSKDKDQRSMDIDIAKSLLELLLDKWVLCKYFVQFLTEKKYKVINKDQWCNILEFSRSIAPDLHNYDEDGAWPVLLDEFVEWYRHIIPISDIQ